VQPPTAPATPRLELHWVVRRLGGGRPKKMHATREAAIAEAERLATHSPGSKFCIFECRLVRQVCK